MSINRRTTTLLIRVAAVAVSLIITPGLAHAATDPAATAIIKAAATAHKQLKAFSYNLSLREAEGTHTHTVSMSFSFRKPDQAKVTVVEGGHPVFRGVSSGKEILVYSLDDKKYLIRGIAKGGRGAIAIGVGSRSAIIKAYLHPDAIMSMAAAPEAHAHFACTSSVDGEAVDIIDTVIESAPDHLIKGDFGFSHRTHLLRSMALIISGQRGQARVDEIVHNLSTAPRLADADFVVSAPKGASELTAADVEQPLMHDAR